MFRIVHIAFVITFVSLSAKMAFALTLSKDASHATTPNSTADELICYFQSKNGEILDLSYLCGKRSPNGSNQKDINSGINQYSAPSNYNPNSNYSAPSNYNPNSNYSAPSN